MRHNINGNLATKEVWLSFHIFNKILITLNPTFYSYLPSALKSVNMSLSEGHNRLYIKISQFLICPLKISQSFY